MKLNEQLKQKKKNLVIAFIILTLTMPFILQGATGLGGDSQANPIDMKKVASEIKPDEEVPTAGFTVKIDGEHKGDSEGALIIAKAGQTLTVEDITDFGTQEVKQYDYQISYYDSTGKGGMLRTGYVDAGDIVGEMSKEISLQEGVYHIYLSATNGILGAENYIAWSINGSHNVVARNAETGKWFRSYYVQLTIKVNANKVMEKHINQTDWSTLEENVNATDFTSYTSNKKDFPGLEYVGSRVGKTFDEMAKSPINTNTSNIANFDVDNNIAWHYYYYKVKGSTPPPEPPPVDPGVVSTPPIASFIQEPPNPVYVGERVYYTDTSYDAEDDIVYWEWIYNSKGTEIERKYGQEVNKTYAQKGNYDVELYITDADKNGDEARKETIAINPMPVAKLVQTGTLKINRKVTISGESSISPRVDEIQSSRTEFRIIPLEGQGEDSICIDKDTKTTLKKDIVFKETGKYRVTLKLHNNYTDKNPTDIEIGKRETEIIIDIKEDIAPTPTFATEARVIRNTTSKQAEIVIYSMQNGISDSDLVDVETIRYTFDANNDGIYSEAQSLPIPFNPTTRRGSFWVSHVGKYQVEYFVKEKFGQETIEKFTSVADRKQGRMLKVVEVDNIAPVVSFEVGEQEKIDLAVMVGDIAPNKVAELQTKIDTYVKAELGGKLGDIDLEIKPIVYYGAQSLDGITEGAGRVKYLDEYKNMEYAFEQNGNRYFVARENATSHYINNLKELEIKYKISTEMIKTQPNKTQQEDRESPYNSIIYQSAGSTQHIGQYIVKHEKRSGIYDDEIPGGYYLTLLDASSKKEIGRVKYTTREYNSYAGEEVTLKVKRDSINVEIRDEGSIVGEGSIEVALDNNIIVYTEFITGFHPNIWQGNIAYAFTYKLSIPSQGELLGKNIQKNNFRANSKRYLLNIVDTAIEGFETTNKEVLRAISKMVSENINFVQMGTDKNKEQALKVINDTGGKFIYSDKPDVIAGLKEYTAYILSLLKKENVPIIKYLLLNKELNSTVSYSDYEKDPIYAISSYWKYNHTRVQFENGLGVLNPGNNIWRKEPIKSFDKVGKYVIDYKVKDNPVAREENFDSYRKDATMLNGAINLYVHRKPLAQLDFRIIKAGTNFTLNYIDNSYDIDHQSMSEGYYRYGNVERDIVSATSTNGFYVYKGGLSEKIYEYKEVGAGEWEKGKLAGGDLNKKYLIRLTVRDIDGDNLKGEYSEPIVYNIPQLDNNPPVPIFEVEKVTKLGELVNIEDKSYDKDGDSFTKEWKLYKKIGGTGSDQNDWKEDTSSSREILYYNETDVKIGLNTYLHREVRPWSNGDSGIRPKKYIYGNGEYKLELKIGDKSCIREFEIVPSLEVVGVIKGNSEGKIEAGQYITIEAITKAPTASMQLERTKSVNANIVEVTFLGKKINLSEEYNRDPLATERKWRETFFVPSDTPDGEYKAEFYAESETFSKRVKYPYLQEARTSVTINIGSTIKLDNYRVTKVDKHNLAYPLRANATPLELPFDYMAGYYITFRIDSISRDKTKPITVFAQVNNDSTLDKTVTMKKISTLGDTITWEGRYYTSTKLAKGTEIRMNINGYQDKYVYNYNSKAPWNGKVAIVVGSADDGVFIHRTN